MKQKKILPQGLLDWQHIIDAQVEWLEKSNNKINNNNESDNNSIQLRWIFEEMRRIELLNARVYIIFLNAFTRLKEWEACGQLVISSGMRDIVCFS